METGKKFKVLSINKYKKQCRNKECIFNGGSRPDGFGGCRLNMPKITVKNDQPICASSRVDESQRKQV